MSFIGGGTDLPSFPGQGAVISTAIDKYVYITVNKRFDETIRVSYSQTEIVDKVDQLQHTICREAMKQTGVTSGVEITSIADVPAGTGLGSSSTFAVGLLNALHSYRGQAQSSRSLAEEACRLELEILKEPIGKQDQYAAAFGGLRRYLFNPDGTVVVDPVICTPRRREEFFEHLMLFYVGGTRSASQILGEAGKVQTDLTSLRGLVDDFWDVLTRGRDIRGLGEILHLGWEHKKQMSQNITSPVIDKCYEAARDAGAMGGKILGAGQSGFLMLFCEPKFQHAVRHELWMGENPREIPFGYEPNGSQIIYVGN